MALRYVKLAFRHRERNVPVWSTLVREFLGYESISDASEAFHPILDFLALDDRLSFIDLVGAAARIVAECTRG